jgi:hypothetical protein
MIEPTIPKNSHLWAHDNPNRTIESNFQVCFSVNMWSGGTGDQLLEPCIFLQCLVSDIYAGFVQNELLTLL